MKITRIDIENFLAIGSASVELSDRGLVLIQGENLDDPSANSNGAGKSSLVEALSWALYGETAKGLRGDDVINRNAGKGTVVTVTVEDGDSRFEIARYRKHKTGKNSVTVWRFEEPEIQTNLTGGTNKITQALVDQIIGSTHEVFTAAVYAGQEAMPNIPAMTDRQLKVLIEEAAGITVLERAYEIARRKARAQVSDAKDAQNKLDMLTERRELLEEQVQDAERAVKHWAVERDQRIIDMRKEAEQEIADARALRADLDKMPTMEGVEAEIAELEKTLASHEDDRARLSLLQKAAMAAERKAERAAANVENAAQALKHARAELDEVRGQIGEPCVECGRPHNEETLEVAIDRAEHRVKEAGENAKHHLKEARAAKGDAESASERASEFEQSLPDQSEVASQRASLALSRERRNTVARDIAKTTQRVKDLKDAMLREKARENPHEAELTTRRERLEETINKLAEASRKTAAAHERSKLLETVAEIYGPAGVRAHILDSVTPYLNARTANYLGALTDGAITVTWQTLSPTKKGDMRESFSVQVEHGGASGFAGLSGGEKRKVRVACALALQDLVASRASKPIDLFIADEVDAALDNSGLERLMGVLEDKARERGSVFVISHSDLSDWISNTLTVRKQDGVAELA